MGFKDKDEELEVVRKANLRLYSENNDLKKEIAKLKRELKELHL